MKTTLNIDGELLRRAKRQAAEHGTTLTTLVEEALRAALAEPRPPRRAGLDFPTFEGGGGAAVDPADRDSLYERMDARDRS